LLADENDADGILYVKTPTFFIKYGKLHRLFLWSET
jgi:hypothetical protein